MRRLGAGEQSGQDDVLGRRYVCARNGTSGWSAAVGENALREAPGVPLGFSESGWPRSFIASAQRHLVNEGRVAR